MTKGRQALRDLAKDLRYRRKDHEEFEALRGFGRSSYARIEEKIKEFVCKQTSREREIVIEEVEEIRDRFNERKNALINRLREEDLVVGDFTMEDIYREFHPRK